MPDMIDFRKRPIAITDVETTGLDAHIHEIIEIGLLVVKPDTMEIIDEFEAKIHPTHIETAAAKAFEINGYNPRDWKKAITLGQAMKIYSEKTTGAVFLAHNTFLDWSFIAEAFKKTGVEDYLDYHRLDLFSIAWGKKEKLPGLKKFHLSEICKYLGVPEEPKPHRAINGVYAELEVLKKLLKL